MLLHLHMGGSLLGSPRPGPCTEVKPHLRAISDTVNCHVRLPGTSPALMQGDFYQWLALFNHFDAYYDKHVAPRADLQLKVPGEEDYSQPEQLPARTLEQMLKFTAVVLENCSNKHVYHSYEVCCHGMRLSALDRKVRSQVPSLLAASLAVLPSSDGRRFSEFDRDPVLAMSWACWPPVRGCHRQHYIQ